jgi:CRISPR/Cas system-associated exonuclease Cas4 (RecB family)
MQNFCRNKNEEILKEKEIDFYKTNELKRCEYCPYKLICGRG